MSESGETWIDRWYNEIMVAISIASLLISIFWIYLIFFKGGGEKK